MSLGVKLSPADRRLADRGCPLLLATDEYCGAGPLVGAASRDHCRHPSLDLMAEAIVTASSSPAQQEALYLRAVSCAREHARWNGINSGSMSLNQQSAIVSEEVRQRVDGVDPSACCKRAGTACEASLKRRSNGRLSNPDTGPP
jgi:hypothetical protein